MVEDFVLTLTPEIQVQVMNYRSRFYMTLKYTHDSWLCLGITNY